MTAQQFLRHKLDALHHHEPGSRHRVLTVPRDPAAECCHESLEVTWDDAEDWSAYHCRACGERIPRDDLPEVWRVWRP
jgi:hypothetical protein